MGNANTDYTTEIAQFMGGISQILSNIQVLLDKLPIQRDLTDVKVELLELKNSLNRIHERLDFKFEELEEVESNNFKDLKDSINDVVVKLTTTLDRKINVDDQIVKDHITITQQIIDTITDWSDNIMTTGELSRMILKECQRVEHVLGNDKIEIEDVREVITYAKRQNARWKFWTGWKAKLIMVVGLISAILISLHTVIEGLRKLVDIFKG